MQTFVTHKAAGFTTHRMPAEGTHTPPKTFNGQIGIRGMAENLFDSRGYRVGTGQDINAIAVLSSGRCRKTANAAELLDEFLRIDSPASPTSRPPSFDS